MAEAHSFSARLPAQEKVSSSLAQSCMSPATRTPAKPSIIPNKPKDMIDEARRPGEICVLKKDLPPYEQTSDRI